MHEIGESVWIDDKVKGQSTVTLEPTIARPLPELPATSAIYRIQVSTEPEGSATVALPVTVTSIPTGYALEVLVASVKDGPWQPVAATLSADNTHAVAEVPHFSYFTSLLVPVADMLKVLKTIFDDYTSGAFTSATQPTCNGTKRVRSDGWQVLSSGKKAMLWCVGRDDNGDPSLKVTNSRRYPLILFHKGLSETDRPNKTSSLPKTFAEAVARGGSVLLGGEEVAYRVNKDAVVSSQFDGAAHFLATLQVSTEAIAIILSGGNRKVAAELAVRAFVGIVDVEQCLEAGLHPENVGLVIKNCFNTSDLVKAFGEKALFAVALASAAPVLEYMRASLGAVADQLTDADKHTLRVVKLPAVGVVWAPAQQGYGTVAPKRIFNGGSPSGLIEDITWTSYGGARAVGHGRALFVVDSVADAKWETATVVASRLGTCRGTYAYLSVTWYFPKHGEEWEDTPSLCDSDTSGDSSTPPSGPSCTNRNDAQNSAGWRISTLGVGPLQIGMSAADALRCGLIKKNQPGDGCTRPYVDTIPPGSSDTYPPIQSIWENDRLTYLAVNGRRFKTLSAVAPGDPLSKVLTTYDDIRTIKVDLDEELVLLDDQRFVIFYGLNGRPGTVQQIGIGEGKPANGLAC